MYKPLEEISATCTEEDQPIFRNVKHALHVAFLMEVIDFHAKSNLRRLIEIAAQKYGIDEPQVRSVNWGRMTDMEKKATGAMIRCTCQRLLPESLFFFVVAKYSHVSLQKVPAIAYCAENLFPFCKIQDSRAIAHMLCHAINHGRPSGDEIAQKFRVRRETISRDIRIVEEAGREFDQKVNDILRPVFRGDGAI